MSGSEFEAEALPTLQQIFRVFGRIGLLSFGGPAAQISLMHRVLVDEKEWLSENQFLNALSFCMLLPGPEAMQLATYAGWRLKGVFGGLIAGLLFVLPGAAVILGLATIYALFSEAPIVATLFLGVKACVLIIVLEALLRISKRAIKQPIHWIIAVGAFIAIFLLGLPYPVIIVVAAAVGLFLSSGHGFASGSAAVKVSPGETLKTIAIWLVIWWAPLLIVDQVSGLPILSEIGLFFSKLAIVTFGGAYAVLTYMAQDVVTRFGWLGAAEMMDGLGLAETTPGPLILVTEFVAFLAAFRVGGAAAGLAGAAVALWVTFVPCFLWIFAGAPYIDWISAQPRLRGAMDGITAAVVGVILNLSIWFGLHVLFASVARERIGVLQLWLPDLTSIDWRVVVLAFISGLLLLKLHWGITRVLLTSSALGWVLVSLS